MNRVAFVSSLIFCVVCCVMISHGDDVVSEIASPPALDTLAVLTLQASDSVKDSDALLLSDRLASEMAKSGAYRIINRRKMEEDHPDVLMSGTNTCGDVSCAIEIGKTLSARFLVYGSVGMAGAAYALNTHMIDVESGVMLKTASTEGYKSIEDVLTKGVPQNAGILSEREDNGNLLASQNRTALAILPFDARAGISKDEVDLLSDRFASEIHKPGKFAVVPRNKMELILKEQEFSRSDSCAIQECAIEAGRLLGVRYMAYGSVGSIGKLYSVNSAIVDVETGEITASAITDYEGTLQDFLVYGISDNAQDLMGIENKTTPTIRRQSSSSLPEDWSSKLSPSKNNYWAIFDDVEAGLSKNEMRSRILLGQKWWAMSLKYDFGDPVPGFDDADSFKVDLSLNIPLYNKLDLYLSANFNSLQASRQYTERRSYTAYETRRYYWWYYSWLRTVRVTRYRTVTITEDLDYMAYGVDAFFRLRPVKNDYFTPFLFAGPSLYKYDLKYDYREDIPGSGSYKDSDSYDDDKIEFVYGVGVDWRLSDSTSLHVTYTDYERFDMGLEEETSVSLLWHAYKDASYSLGYTKQGDSDYVGVGFVRYR
jgi:TolB-like protein/opacity protein-like surface antigen